MVKKGRYQLPPDDIIADAIEEYRKHNKGRFPGSTSPSNYLPVGWGNGWGSLLSRMKQERGLTAKDILLQSGYHVSGLHYRERGTQLDATHIFNSVIKFMETFKRLPCKPDDIVYECNLSFLRHAFREGNVFSLDQIPALSNQPRPIPSIGTLDIFDSFLLSSGLAIQSLGEHHELIANNDPLPSALLTQEAA